MYTEQQRQILLSVARRHIQQELQTGNQPKNLRTENYDHALQASKAVFVTLTIDQILRGCIGTTQAQLPLVSSVAKYACAAAFRDPRFKPLNQEEFSRIKLSISILTPAEPLEFASEQELINQIRPGIDGLIIHQGLRNAMFLPAVWVSLPVATQFLEKLKTKAKIPPHEMPTAAARFQTISVEEAN